MNIKLTLAASLALACSSMSADILNFGYCTDELTGVGHNMEGVNMAAAMRVPADLAKEFAGNKIKTVSIGFGASTPKRVTLFLTYDLAEEPFYTQTANLKVNRFNDVPLTTPYEFEDRDVYVGYKITTTTASDYPIGFDKMAYSYNEDGDWYASSMDADALNSTWRHVGADMGNASIRLLVEGDNLAGWQRRVDPMAVQVPPYVLPGKAFDISMSLQNNGVQDVTSIEVEVALPDKTIAKTIHFDTPLVSSKCAIVQIEGVVTETSGNAVPVSVSVSKVNGQENQSKKGPVSADLLSSAYLSKRPLILEEATGTWCGWCVSGYVALEQMREKYTDGSYIGIAVHNHGGRGLNAEPMHCASYQEFVSRHVSGFPKALANRMKKFSPYPSEVQAVYDLIHELPANIMLDVEAEVSEADPSKALVKVTAKSLKEIQSHKYGIAIVLTEDNVGPYNQYNYYSGGGSGSMGGFENESAVVSLKYNDVARDIFDWMGNADALPSTLEADVDYTYEREVSLANVDVKANAHVIALLIDTSNEQIETGATKRLIGSSSVDMQHEQKKWKVNAAGGMVNVMGDDVDSVAVYSMSGALCATIEGPGAAALPSGIYVVTVKIGGDTHSVKVAL